MDPTAPPQTGPITETAADKALFSKVGSRLLPLLVICYVIAYMDRINIGYAQLQMQHSLGFSSEAYALGASIFFLGYILFEVPSNLMLEKVGVRKTLLRIMFCWGIVAAAMMYVHSPVQFYILRFLLGAFEAGFFPGVILYLTYWYPATRRGKVIAIFLTAAAIGGVIAGPLSGVIMKHMDGFLNHDGWQWLFVVQGLPASVLGVIAFFYLKDKPEDAGWLSPAEKARLRNHLDNDPHAVGTASHGSFFVLLRDPKIYTLSLAYFLAIGASYTMIFWGPTLIRSWGVADVFWVGVLSAIPALCAMVGGVLIGRSSDRHLERRKHYLFAAVLAGGGLLVTVFLLGNLVGSLAGFCLMSTGMLSLVSLFFTAASEYLPQKTAAGGIALVSTLGMLGSFVSPPIFARINTLTGSPVMSMYLVAAMLFLSGAILMVVLRPTAHADRDAMTSAQTEN